MSILIQLKHWFDRTSRIFALILFQNITLKETCNVRKEEFQFVRETIFPFEFQTNAKKVNKLILVQPRKEF
jgi:hypothetical protein